MKYEKPPCHGFRYPEEIIGYSVWLYHRFCLSLRDVEELLAERGIEVSYESIRLCCHRFRTVLSDTQIIVRRYPTNRHVNENDKCVGSNRLARLSGFFQYMAL